MTQKTTRPGATLAADGETTKNEARGTSRCVGAPRRWLWAACAALCLGAAPLSGAQAAYPERAVQFLVPFGPGSGIDTVARLLGEAMQADLAQPVVVVNRTGAQGAVGARAAAQAAPDGYTVFFTSQSTQAGAPALMKNPGFDPLTDFLPVGRVAFTPALLVAHPGTGISTLDDLKRRTQAEPGVLTYASGGAGTYVPMLMLASTAGLDMTHVPYQTIPAGLNDVIAGHVNMMFTDIVTGSQQVQAGRVVPVAISSPERWPSLPDVPAIAETYPGFELYAWYGMYVPVGTPQQVIDTLSGALKRALAQPAVQARLEAMTLRTAYSTPQELADFTRSEYQKWGDTIRRAGVEPQ